MPRRPLRTAPVVIIPGWYGSGEGHWQPWLREQLTAAGREVRWPDLGDLDEPRPAAWLGGLRAALDGLPDEGFDVIGHSLGAITWLHHAADPDPSPRPARVALVSPPSPNTTLAGIAAFFPPPMGIDAVRHAAGGTILIGGSDDPYLPEGIALEFGRPLKMPTTVLDGAGHINVESGYGAWPAMLDWCNRDNLAFY